MLETRQLVDTLKKCLRSRGLTYRDVASHLGLSESSVKRLFAARTLSLDRFGQICELAEVSVYDVARLARTGTDGPPRELSMAQERALAKDARLLACFYLLLQGWTPPRIARRFDLGRVAITRCLTRLDRLGLIELLPRNKVRLLTSRSIDWRSDGPVRRAHEDQIRLEFLRGDFSGDRQLERFETAELSEASAKLLARRIDRLGAEFNELAELDLAVPAAQKQGVGLWIGFRPWVFSMFAGIARRRPR